MLLQHQVVLSLSPSLTHTHTHTGGRILILSFVLVLLVKQDSNNGVTLCSLLIELSLTDIDYSLLPLMRCVRMPVCVSVCVSESDCRGSDLFCAFTG